MEKRDFLKTTAIGGLGLATTSSWASTFETNYLENGDYKLPKLPYACNALEPYIDEQTMRLHHSKHHQGYVNGLNNALTKLKEAKTTNDFVLVKHWERELAFHGSGHILHSLFWENMSPNNSKPSNRLSRMIDKDFGGFEQFKNHFVASTAKVEGSGWGILAYEPLGNRLVVLQTEKHQNQTIWNTVPLLVIDVWEHAYYLKYQNKRKDYINAFFEIINWEEVAKRLTK
ncbi:superoxide dismutase [uncultured Aquimarina sp.]|uniref:superoxide dismutase n=1 Tax=uncultured Aquimarina sp. TaxID=575652 RepID=UPI00260EF9AD|nr:superoxide dismutase [uncultured Aquimarina sp.]